MNSPSPVPLLLSAFLSSGLSLNQPNSVTLMPDLPEEKLPYHRKGICPGDNRPPTMLHRLAREADGFISGGKWVTWHFGERFVGVDASRDQLRVFLAGLRGEPPPPNRLGVKALPTGIEYPQLYQYQEPLLTNFPRF